MLVTVERYRQITGDGSTLAPLVTARIEQATERLEDDLGRPLAEAERTETLWPDRAGMLWPSCVPLVSAGGYTIVGDGLVSTLPFGVPSIIDGSCSVDVTYTGGFVERTANPTAANRLPTCIEADLAWAARALAPPDASGIASQIPAGATEVQLGDARIRFGDGGAPSVSAANIVWSRQTLAWSANRRPRGA